MAMKAALQKAGPLLLEPVMTLEAVTPGEFLGDILADLGGRRARIRNIEGQGDTQVISAHVPLSEVFGYATQIRSLTQGRATHSMEFKEYLDMPESLVREVVSRK